MISMDKKYRYSNKDNGKARILCVDSPDKKFPIISLNNKGVIEKHTITGGVWGSGNKSDYDLVEIKPYEDFPIDAKVFVWSNLLKEKHKRYFAGVDKDGRPTVWVSGQTSWTVEHDFTSAWDNCELAE